MSALVPRSTIHRGVVRAHGFWFGAGVVSTDELRARVLAAWEPGAQVFALDAGYVVQLSQDRLVTVSACPAAPLTRQGKTLTSAPLRPSELAALPDDAWLVLVEAGRPRAILAGQLRAVDLAEWLDLSAFQRLAAAPVAALADPPSALLEGRDPRVELEQRLARTDELRAQQSQLVNALNDAHAAAPPRSSGIAPTLLRGLLFGLGLLFGPGGLSSYFSSHTGQTTTALAPAQRAPGWLERLSATLARAIASTRVMRLLARKQAAYLRTLLDALDARDDAEVLRRAIPLNNAQGSGPLTPALAPPPLRTDLRISLTGRRPGSSIGLDGDLFADLRRAYEAVLERLIRAGKHEEAAFFLAEILQAPERAVDHLERHGKRRLAAELAEARNLAPGLVVRLWFLAGDSRRAVTIAVREGAFSDAIARLERAKQTKEADALRFLQADRLADAGHWLAAARIVVDRPGGAAFALRWLELLRESGEVQGLALELSLDAERFERVQAALEPLLADATAYAAKRRALVAEELMRLGVVAGKPLARELGRELLVDAAAHGERGSKQTARRLADWLGGAFRADFPGEVPEPDTVRPSPRHEYMVAARDVGTRPIHDAAQCGSRFVVALGEAGVIVLNRAGKRVAELDVPAEQLVVSEDGTRLLALARRGDAWRVSQIDLASHRARAWGELRLDVFARTFDGETWVVARGAELLVLDVLDDTPSVLRRVPVLEHGVRRIQLDRGACNVLTSDFDVEFRLRYELPHWTLRERKAIELGPSPPVSIFFGDVAVASSGPVTVCATWLTPADSALSPLTLRYGGGELVLPRRDRPSQRKPVTLTTSARSFAVSSLSQEESAQVLVGSLGTSQSQASQLQASLLLQGASAVRVRVDDESVLIGDDLGRLLVLDLRSGRLAHDLRL